MRNDVDSRRRVLSALACSPLALAGSQAGAFGRWPAPTVSPGPVGHGKWIWQELLTADPDTAVAFYSRVFGWSFGTRGVGSSAYRLASHQGRPVAGVVRVAGRREVPVPASRWIGLMSVPDVDAAIVRATGAGGRVLVPSTLQSGRGRVAMLADPEGAPFGVMRTADGDPPDAEPAAGEWLWRELWATDPARMAAWYRDLGNYGLLRVSGSGDRDEWLLSGTDVPRAGVIDKPLASLASAWLPYLRVADLSATLDAVGAAGGRVLAPPSPQRRAGRVAIVADPVGGVVGLAQWTREAAR